MSQSDTALGGSGSTSSGEKAGDYFIPAYLESTDDDARPDENAAHYGSDKHGVWHAQPPMAARRERQGGEAKGAHKDATEAPEEKDAADAGYCGDINVALAGRWAPACHVSPAVEQCAGRRRRFDAVLRHGKLPNAGWPVADVDRFVRQLHHMDTNQFDRLAGAGEREGRIVCPLVASWHGAAHGIGRSGDVTAAQPKAAGASVANTLCNSLALDALRLAGLGRQLAKCVVLPVCTGMALVLCLLRLASTRAGARKVLWCRIDQKTCVKAVLTAGLELIPIDPVAVADQLVTNVQRLRTMLTEVGPRNVVCVVTTTGCFAPRAHDDVPAVGRLCAELGVPHLVNNAYGVQIEQCAKAIHKTHVQGGRVDFVVQSTDKNFCVPVGGSIVASYDAYSIDALAMSYPGRASAAPTMDLLATLLYLGTDKWRELLHRRKIVFVRLKEKMAAVAEKHGERMLATDGNFISMAMTLAQWDSNGADPAQLGANLFRRRCSGARVVAKGDGVTVAGVHFRGWGAHCGDYPCSYLCVAAAVGMTEDEVDLFTDRLDRAMADSVKSMRKADDDDDDDDESDEDEEDDDDDDDDAPGPGPSAMAAPKAAGGAEDDSDDEDEEESDDDDELD